MALIDFDGDGKNDLVELWEAIFDKNGDGTVNAEDLKEFFMNILEGQDGKFTAEDVVRILSELQAFLKIK